MKSTSPPLNNYQWKTSQLFKAQAWTSADNNPNKFRTNEYKPMESTTKYRSSSSLIHWKPPSLGATGKRNLISVLYLQHGANGKGGIELFPRRLFRWMIRVKSSIITNSYSLPVTVNFEYVPQFRTTPIHTRRLGSKATVKRLLSLKRVGGRGTVRMTGWPVSWASIEYWEFF